MADDKSNRGGQDRSRVASEQPYEVAYFATKHGISRDAAERIIRENGPSRAKCDAAAKRMNG